MQGEGAERAGRAGVFLFGSRPAAFPTAACRHGESWFTVGVAGDPPCEGGVVCYGDEDPRGIAQLQRMGWYRPVHCKSLPAQEVRALLAERKICRPSFWVSSSASPDCCAVLGLKMGEVSKSRFAARVEALIVGHDMLEPIMGSMLAARGALRAEFNCLHRAVLAIARKDAVCRRLMTAQGLGALTAITYKAGVDDPARFAKSKAVGAHFGLTQKRYHSGETDITGGISKVGDVAVRTASFEAANAVLSRSRRFSILKN